MRNFTRLFFSVLINIVGLTAYAQVHITINDVAKIHLIDAAGYLDGGFRNSYDLLRENGEWKCYQTHERYSRLNYKERNPKKMRVTKDSAEHLFIKTLPADSISLFLKAIGTVKPKFNAADLKVSIPEITKKIDTGYLKNMDEKKIQVFNSFFNTPAKLNHLLDTLQHDFWTDDYPSAAIEIIKKTGDTIKVYTNRQVDYMLPWQINKTATYNIRINAFFINATGLTNHRMSGRYLSSQLYSWVNHLYARNAFERMRWQQTAPENVKYIQQHFDIIQVDKNNDYSTYIFHPKNLPAGVRLAGLLNVSNKSQLMALTKFAGDTLKSFLKKGGFMIDSCLAKKGCTISFINSYGQSLHEYFSMNQPGLDSYMKKFKKLDLFTFRINAGERTEDAWVATPDGKFVLVNYLDNYAVGVLPQYIKKDSYLSRRFVFMIFTADGKLTYQGYNR